MADLKYSDKVFLEKAFQMSSGYVLDFSDRTFEDFVGSVLVFNVHEKYTGSKANKMREIWKNESNTSVAKLLNALCDLMKIEDTQTGYTSDFNEIDFLQKRDTDRQKIIKIAQRLTSKNSIIENHEKIVTYEHLPDFIKNAWEDLSNERYWYVITNARTILEITFKEICKRRSIEFVDNNINKTFTNIRKYFGMDAKTDEYPNHIKQLITGTATIVNNIAEARNDCSSAHAPKYKPKKHHAQFCLEQAISLMNFIISVEESFQN